MRVECQLYLQVGNGLAHSLDAQPIVPFALHVCCFPFFAFYWSTSFPSEKFYFVMYSFDVVYLSASASVVSLSTKAFLSFLALILTTLLAIVYSH